MIVFDCLRLSAFKRGQNPSVSLFSIFLWNCCCGQHYGVVANKSLLPVSFPGEPFFEMKLAWTEPAPALDADPPQQQTGPSVAASKPLDMPARLRASSTDRRSSLASNEALPTYSPPPSYDRTSPVQTDIAAAAAALLQQVCIAPWWV